MKTKLTLPLLGGLILLAAGSARAAFDTKELQINRSGTAISVSVSTSAWTQANNSTSFLKSRAGYVINNFPDNSGDIYGLCKESAPAEAITVPGFVIEPGENPLRPCGQNLNLYLRSTSASGETVTIWEVGQ